MQAAVERVIRSFTMKQPVQDAPLGIHDGVMHDNGQNHATQLAAQLLGNYRDRLAERSRTADNSQQG